MSTTQPAPPTSPEKFDAASSWLSSTPAAASLPNEIKLELYGLFRFVGSGEGPSGSRPSIFYPAARAKHDAWAAQALKHHSGHKGSSERALAAARGRYVQIAKQVGWDGRIEDDVDLERLDDSDPESNSESGPSERAERGGAKGKAKDESGLKWRSVSVMAQPGDDHGADDGKGEGSTSPIHDAVTADDLNEVRKLLDKQPELVNAIDEFGYTPLHLAADRGYSQMTRLLIQHGADKEVKDEDEQTAIVLAEISGRDDIVAILRE